MDKVKYKARGKWSFFWFTLIFGLILAFIGVTIGIGFTIKIPLTKVNLSGGGSIGKKEVVKEALPNYLKERIADNNTFINQTHTMTIWIAEGMGVFVLGEQPEAPNIDLSVKIK